MSGPADALARLLAAFDWMEIPYMVGGSVASSVYGLARPTLDVDIVARIESHQVDEFVQSLSKDFYGDAASARAAISRAGSFSLIHFRSTYKFDIFPLRAQAFDREEFSRRAFRESFLFGPTIEFCVASAEDTILAKLRWFRMGAEASERQLEDVRGIVRVQGNALDWDYLHRWAQELGVQDLLTRIR